MKRKPAIITTIAVCIIAVSGFTLAKAGNFNTTRAAKVASYAIGYNQGFYYGNSNSSKVIKVKMLVKGLQDGLAKKKSVYSQKAMKQAMLTLRKVVQQNIAVAARRIAAANLKASNKYLKKVAKTAGVKKIQKGLYYKVMKQGTGKKPTVSDIVTINYQASLPNGKVIFNTFKTHKPTTFVLGKSIMGWQQTIKRMTLGSIWTVYVAPSLAYGTKKAPLDIGPNQALKYKIQLIAIKPSR